MWVNQLKVLRCLKLLYFFFYVSLSLCGLCFVLTTAVFVHHKELGLFVCVLNYYLQCNHFLSAQILLYLFKINKCLVSIAKNLTCALAFSSRVCGVIHELLSLPELEVKNILGANDKDWFFVFADCFGLKDIVVHV